MNSPTETALQTGPPERRRTPFVHYGVNNFYDIHDKSYNVSLAYIFNKNKTRNQKNTQRNNNIPCMPHQQNACRGLALSGQEMIMSKTALYLCFMFIYIKELESFLIMHSFDFFQETYYRCFIYGHVLWCRKYSFIP